MPVIYDDELFTVKQGWFGPWRVVNKSTGATIAPELILQEKVGLVWPRIRGNQDLEPRFRRFCEDVMFQLFAIAAIYPNDEMGNLFTTAPPAEIAAIMIEEATKRVRLISGA